MGNYLIFWVWKCVIVVLDHKKMVNLSMKLVIFIYPWNQRFTYFIAVFEKSSNSCHFKTSLIYLFNGLNWGRWLLHQKKCCEVGGVSDGEYHRVKPQEQHENPSRIHTSSSSLRFTEMKTEAVEPGEAKLCQTAILVSAINQYKMLYILPRYGWSNLFKAPKNISGQHINMVALTNDYWRRPARKGLDRTGWDQRGWPAKSTGGTGTPGLANEAVEAPLSP